MTVKDINKYQIKCDLCGAIEIVEVVGTFYGLTPRPSGWKLTHWSYRRYSSLGAGSGSIDQCPKCVDKEIKIPEKALRIKTEVY